MSVALATRGYVAPPATTVLPAPEFPVAEVEVEVETEPVDVETEVEPGG